MKQSAEATVVTVEAEPAGREETSTPITATYRVLIVARSRTVRVFELKSADHTTVKQAFESKGPHEEAYIELIETGSRARILRP